MAWARHRDGNASRTPRPTLKTNTQTQSTNRTFVAAVLHSHRIERRSTWMRARPEEPQDEPTTKLRSKPNSALCFQQKLKTKAKFHPAAAYRMNSESHSCRNAITGSTLVARRAGRNAANTATAPSVPTAIA